MSLDILDALEYEAFETPSDIDPAKFPVIRDVKDLPILASAILSDADILLTGDGDFRDVPIEKPVIFTPSEYYDLIAVEDL